MNKYDPIKLNNQLCFPLYAASRGIVKRYTPFLKKLDLTYTQYITMMVMWEHKRTNVKDLGRKLYLDSGTLTPLLKKLENKGYIIRHRSSEDERNLIVETTPDGEALRDRALTVSSEIKSCIRLEKEELDSLSLILNKILSDI